MRPFHRRPSSTWQAPDQPQASAAPGTLSRLSAQVAAASAPARSVIGQRRRSVSDRLLSIGDLIADASTTPAGRTITAAACLTGAWALIGA